MFVEELHRDPAEDFVDSVEHYHIFNRTGFNFLKQNSVRFYKCPAGMKIEDLERIISEELKDIQYQDDPTFEVKDCEYLDPDKYETLEDCNIEPD